MPNHTPLTIEEREAVLFLEVVAFLHDIGKFSDQFLKNHASDWPQNTPKIYNYELRTDIFSLFPKLATLQLSPSHLADLVKDAQDQNKSALYKEWSDITTLLFNKQLYSWEQNAAGTQKETYNLAELTLLASQWASNVDWSDLVGKGMQPAQLVGRLHGAAHYEKKTGSGNSGGGQPYLDRPMYQATAFGWETPVSGTSIPETLSDLLTQLPLSTLNKIGTEDRYKWLAEMQRLMQHGIADTRRAINDVTLWDWGYSVASLVKPAAYTIFQSGWPIDVTTLAYRTLRINLDILGIYERSDKISDLLGIRDTLDKSFTSVQKLIESTMALGNRSYHDQTGAYYLLPDIENIEGLRSQIQEYFPKDAKPLVHIGKPVTISDLDNENRGMDRRQRNAVADLISNPRQQAIQELDYPIDTDNNFFPDEFAWKEGRPENTEICTVCGTRPVGSPSESAEAERIAEQGYDLSDSWATEEKARSRNICRICLVRRGRRSQSWLDSGLKGTIWTDEVADQNGRLALIVGSLGLDDWLNGDLLDTLMADINKTRKMASPARLYRIAETGRDFWQEVTNKTTPDEIGQRPYRLAIYPEDTHLDLGSAYAYELDLGDIALSVVWDRQKRRFVTNENLAYFFKRWSVFNNLSEQDAPNEDDLETEGAIHLISYLEEATTLRVMEPSSFLTTSKEVTEITVAQVDTLGEYTPQISLLAEPGLGMILVPAAKALSLAKAIKTKYETEMGRVLDRLPLHLGIVFFPRRTPLTAVLSAGRRLLQMPSRWEGWQVEKYSNYGLSFSRNGRTFTHTYPEYMGDGETTDEWYPNLLTVDPTTAKNLTAKNAVKHVRMIMPGETVFIRPGLFDFVFLDATGRRFEVSYDTEAGKRPLRPTRPFLLADLDRLETLWQRLLHLEVSQRYQVIYAIETTREAWHGHMPEESLTDPIFVQFVRDSLAGAAWDTNEPWSSFNESQKQQIVQAGIKGELADLAELHMKIMKEPR